MFNFADFTYIKLNIYTSTSYSVVKGLHVRNNCFTISTRDEKLYFNVFRLLEKFWKNTFL